VPLYEYQCPNDGTFEIIQKFSDPPLTACPTCGAEVAKLLSAPAIQFKGTGWYITDYARKGGTGSGETKKAGGAAEGGAGGDGAKKDSGAKDSGTSTASSDTKTTASTK
jgi:putative FmdB family regulatory protein